MKSKLLFKQTISLIVFAFFMFLQTGFAQVTITPWKMNKGGGIITYNLPGHGDPAAYSQMNIPITSDSNWAPAPVDNNGAINYSVISILNNCLGQLDFTYFETYINIPANFTINDLIVSFRAADDGARAYIFNSAHPNGAFIGEIRLGQTASTNYASLAKAGEVNRLVIVQFDDCPTGNNLTGAQVKVNGSAVAINTGGCTTSNFFWSNAPTVSGKTATGTINGVAYTYTSSVNVRTTSNVYAHSLFPTSFNVPNNNPTIQNIEASTNTLTFASPMTNPVLVFSSIGGGPISVPINFSAPVEVLWSTSSGSGSSFVQNSPTQITGKEAYAIVRMNGTFSSISFDYLTYENYVNFVFGADFSTTTPDTIAPTVALNGSATQTINAGTPYTDPGATVTDNCDASPTLMVGGSVDINTPGIYTLTYDAVDASGNTATQVTRTVTVVDPVPVVTTQNITVNLGVNGSITITPDQIDNGSSSVVGLSGLSLDISSFDCSNIGINTVTLTATSTLGNTASATATVTVVDNIGPTVNTQPVTLQLDVNGVASLSNTTTYQPVYDNAFSGEPQGGGLTTMANWDVLYGSVDVANFITETPGLSVDLAGNNSSQIRTKSAIALSPGQYKITLEHKQNGANRSFNVSLGSVFNQTFATTSAFKAEEALFTVSASENAYLTLTQLNPVLGDDRSGSFVKNFVISKQHINYSIDNNSSDTCGIQSMSMSKTDFTCADVGDNTVTLTVTDVNGNVSTGTATVTVEDNTVPVIAATPADINIVATSAQGAAVTYIVPVGTDNTTCVTTALTAGLASGATFSIGITVVTYTATDASGNTVSSSFNVEVVGVAPEIVPLGDITQDNDLGLCSAAVSFAATETVGIPASTITYTIAPGSVFAEGTNAVTATATNAIGSSSTTFNVTVNDSELPIVVTQAFTTTITGGVATVSTTDIDGGSTDNCGIESMEVSPNTFVCGDKGDHTVTLTVTDIHGNTNSATATVTVLGDVPTIAIADFTAVPTQNTNTVYLGYGPQSMTLNTTTTGGAGFTYSWTASTGELVASEANPTVSPNVSTTYTVTVTNANGCEDTTSIDVCVIDARYIEKDGEYKGKVLVCHHEGHEDEHHTIKISNKAVEKHLRNHGDTLGGCDATCSTTYVEVITDNDDDHGDGDQADNDDKDDDKKGQGDDDDHHSDSNKVIKVVIYPNPVVNEAHIALDIKKKGEGEVKVYDYKGLNIFSEKTKDLKKGVKVNMRGKQTGNYYVRIKYKGKTYTATLFKKR